MVFKEEEEYLHLSGLQHFSFCRRQWALIHIEQQWVENLRTADGRILHEKAHDGSAREKRGDLIVTRDMSIYSPTLGVSGSCDVVEFHRSRTVCAFTAWATDTRARWSISVSRRATKPRASSSSSADAQPTAIPGEVRTRKWVV